MLNNLILSKLDELSIDYTMLEHQPIMTMAEGESIAKQLGVRACKNLLLTNRLGEHFMLMLVGDKKLNARAVARQIGSPRLSFAPVSDLNNFLSVEQGAVGVLALLFDKCGSVRLLVDKDVASQEYIGCHPGVNTCSLKIRTSDVLGKYLTAIGHEEYTLVEV